MICYDCMCSALHTKRVISSGHMLVAGAAGNWKDRCAVLDLSRHGNRSSAALGMSTPLDVEILVVLFLTCLRLWAWE